MSLSSFGNFRTSGAATPRAPDCSSALGLYVPSVCLLFFTTQKSQPSTANTMARTPSVTVGATMAAMLGPTVLLEPVSLAGVVEFPVKIAETSGAIIVTMQTLYSLKMFQ